MNFKKYMDANGVITIPYGPTSIKRENFKGCIQSATKIIISDSVKTVAARCFQNFEHLDIAIFSDSVTKIGDCAFKSFKIKIIIKHRKLR